MAVSVNKSEMYQAVLSIWGVVYKSEPMTLEQCEQAYNQTRKEYPGINICIYQADQVATTPNTPKVQTLGEMEAADPDVFKTPDAPTVRISIAGRPEVSVTGRIKLSYKNHDLASIVRLMPNTAKSSMTVDVDTMLQWQFTVPNTQWQLAKAAVESVIGDKFKWTCAEDGSGNVMFINRDW